MAAAVAVEDLLARQADLHRPVEHQRRLRDDDLVVERIALAAEAAAVRRGDDADVRGRHRQRLGERAVHVVRRLRARPERRACRRDPARRPRRAARSAGACCPRRRTCPRRRGRRRRTPASTSPNCSDDRLVDVAVVAVVVDARLGMREALLGIGDTCAAARSRRRSGRAPRTRSARRARSTAATGSPTKRTLSRQSACSSWLTGRMPYGIGKSLPVSTRCTPGCAQRARRRRCATMRACGTVERSSLQCTMRGSDQVVGEARLAGDLGAAVDAAPRLCR